MHNQRKLSRQSKIRIHANNKDDTKDTCRKKSTAKKAAKKIKSLIAQGSKKQVPNHTKHSIEHIRKDQAIMIPNRDTAIQHNAAIEAIGHPKPKQKNKLHPFAYAQLTLSSHDFAWRLRQSIMMNHEILKKRQMLGKAFWHPYYTQHLGLHALLTKHRQTFLKILHQRCQPKRKDNRWLRKAIHRLNSKNNYTLLTASKSHGLYRVFVIINQSYVDDAHINVTLCIKDRLSTCMIDANMIPSYSGSLSEQRRKQLKNLAVLYSIPTDQRDAFYRQIKNLNADYFAIHHILLPGAILTLPLLSFRYIPHDKPSINGLIEAFDNTLRRQFGTTVHHDIDIKNHNFRTSFNIDVMLNNQPLNLYFTCDYIQYGMTTFVHQNQQIPIYYRKADRTSIFKVQDIAKQYLPYEANISPHILRSNIDDIDQVPVICFSYQQDSDTTSVNIDDLLTPSPLQSTIFQRKISEQSRNFKHHQYTQYWFLWLIMGLSITLFLSLLVSQSHIFLMLHAQHVGIMTVDMMVFAGLCFSFALINKRHHNQCQSSQKGKYTWTVFEQRNFFDWLWYRDIKMMMCVELHGRKIFRHPQHIQAHEAAFAKPFYLAKNRTSYWHRNTILPILYLPLALYLGHWIVAWMTNQFMACYLVILISTGLLSFNVIKLIEDVYTSIKSQYKPPPKQAHVKPMITTNQIDDIPIMSTMTIFLKSDQHDSMMLSLSAHLEQQIKDKIIDNKIIFDVLRTHGIDTASIFDIQKIMAICAQMIKNDPLQAKLVCLRSIEQLCMPTVTGIFEGIIDIKRSELLNEKNSTRTREQQAIMQHDRGFIMHVGSEKKRFFLSDVAYIRIDQPCQNKQLFAYLYDDTYDSAMDRLYDVVLADRFGWTDLFSLLIEQYDFEKAHDAMFNAQMSPAQIAFAKYTSGTPSTNTPLRACQLLTQAGVFNTLCRQGIKLSSHDTATQNHLDTILN